MSLRVTGDESKIRKFENPEFPKSREIVVPSRPPPTIASRLVAR